MDSNNFFSVQLHYLNLAGISTNYSLGWKGIVPRVFLISTILSNIFWMTVETNYLINNLSELENNADTISNFLTTAFGMVQLVTFSFMRKEIEVLTTQLNLITQNALKDNESTDIVIEYKKKIQMMTKVRHALGVGAGGGVFLKGVLLWLVTGNREHPVKIAFSNTDFSSYPLFEIVFLDHPIAAWGIVFITTATDTLYFSIGLNLIIHLKILQQKLQKINFKTTLSEMILLIKYHKTIIFNFELFLKLYRNILFVQIYIFTSLICFLTFRLGTTNATEQIVNALTFLLAVLLSLLIYDYVGSELMTEDLAIYQSIYQSSWYEASPEVKKLLLVMMSKSQRPMLIAVVLYEATLDTFTNIINAAGSYLTFLKSFSV